MERHIVDHPKPGSSLRLPRYIEQERDNRIRGPHHAINVLRRLPRGSSSVGRVKSYLKIERAG
jgi:hypothetical protein